MAGEWIKIDSGIHRKPEVFAIARKLGRPIDEVVGLLVKFWVWADQSTVDGSVDHMTSTDVDTVVGVPEFAKALMSVKWMSTNKSGVGVLIPNFARHNGESAKKRIQQNASQARWRAGLRAGDGAASTQPSTNSSTREEKRREEKNIKSLKPPAMNRSKVVNRGDGPFGDGR
jgi:hypothetical protein